MKTDVKKDMTPMSELLKNQKTPGENLQTDKFNFLRNGAKDIPEPNLAERKRIMENGR